MLTVSFSCEFLLFRFFSPKNSISYFLHQQGCWRVDSPGFWSCQGSPSCWAVFIAALSHKGSTGWQRGLAVLALTVGASEGCAPAECLGLALPVAPAARCPGCPSSPASVSQDSVSDLEVQHHGFQGGHRQAINPQGVCSAGLGPCNIHKLFAIISNNLKISINNSQVS